MKVELRIHLGLNIYLSIASDTFVWFFFQLFNNKDTGHMGFEFCLLWFNLEVYYG